MKPILALTVLFVVYAAGELVAKKTKAIFSTVLGIAVLLLAGFWSGLLPDTLMTDAQVTGFGNIIAGVLVVSLGTTIDFPELKRQWKVVVTALATVIGAVACIICIGGIVIGRDSAIAGAPIFAGGSAATLIMTNALKEKGLEQLSAFCLCLYVTQKFIGVPLASALLRRSARKMLQDPEMIETYSAEQQVSSAESGFHPLRLPAFFDKPSVYLAKLGIAATLANYLAAATGGKINYLVVCLLMGILLFALGFLEKGILMKTQANGLITFFVTVLIFSNLSSITPQDVFSALPALLVSAACGVAGIAAVGFACSRLLKMDFGLAFSVGISCTFGFPTTMLIPQEVSEAYGRNEKEKAAILNYLLPKMLIAGFVTVTIASVLIAGAVVNML